MQVVWADVCALLLAALGWLKGHVHRLELQECAEVLSLFLVLPALIRNKDRRGTPTRARGKGEVKVKTQTAGSSSAQLLV